MGRKNRKYYQYTGKKYYAVKKGRQNDVIVESWEECKNLVHGYSGAIFKSFGSRNSADDWLESIKIDTN